MDSKYEMGYEKGKYFEKKKWNELKREIEKDLQTFNKVVGTYSNISTYIRDVLLERINELEGGK